MNKLRVSLAPIEHFSLIEEPRNVEDIEVLRSFFCGYLKKQHGIFTQNGRSALSIVLEHLELNRSDEVWITTSFDYPNVSSCVTSTVFNFCKPSRVFSTSTKAVLMIHEFGVVHPRREEVLKLAREHGVPLIEDCAHTFMSSDSLGFKAGELGGWTIISFPKFYPVRRGGMLLSHEKLSTRDNLAQPLLRELEFVSGMIGQTEAFGQLRREVLIYFIKATRELGLKSPMFEIHSDVVGWFFPVSVPNAFFYYEELLARGVDCCIWHGAQIIALPLHQYLISVDQSFIMEMLAEVNGKWREQFH